ncbi:hypothetical protein MOC05_10670 [Bacillus sonorensis]|uniref:hypothetical protein n=1 Tax=Bacillus sonorensis TaxID=119858 RepID=UPI002282BC74|nr:hypothetical protein [Bacillus sonorensis]MCY8025609.1 hypothetical protein [Bacillus sonorensis]
MFRRRIGIHPAVLVLGSAALTMAFSPEIRKRVASMFAGRINGQRLKSSAKDMMMNPADLIKQAFNPGSQMQSGQGSPQHQADHNANQDSSSFTTANQTNAPFHDEQPWSQTNRTY